MPKNNEELSKSIETLIDELFTEDENVEKSIDISGDSNTTADAEANKAPKAQKDEARGAGRPKQISDVPQNDEDGKRAGEYDSSISEDGKEKDQEEADQVKESNQVKESGMKKESGKPQSAPFKKSISDEEYEEFMAFKKSQAEKEAEELKKAEEEKTEALIKSVVERTASRYEDKIEALTKSLNEQKELVKSFASRPRQSKSITNVEALEKSTQEFNNQPESFSKSEMLDAAEELALNKSITEFNEEHMIELENGGFIYDPNARRALENYMQKRK